MEELSNFVFFRVVYEFIHSEIDEFAIHLLSRVMVLATSAALTLLTLWILIQGYRIATGQSRQSMMGLVADSLRTTLILGLACGMAVGGSTLYEFLGSDLPNEISHVVTGSNEPIIEQIDHSLAVMQVALTSIDSLEVAHDPFVNQDKTRALWFTGLGTAGPALMGGGVLLMNQIAMALFIGLGPLFILSLLFEQTKGLFGKWLYYGIGTMFSLAVLSVMVTMALDMVLAVGAAFWLSGSLGGNGEGITSLAMQQGGLGLILTMLILSAPPMAAQFFNGVLGSFSPFSAFGGGMGRRDSSGSGYTGAAQEASQEFHPFQRQFRLGLPVEANPDQVRQLSGEHGSEQSNLVPNLPTDMTAISTHAIRDVFADAKLHNAVEIGSVQAGGGGIRGDGFNAVLFAMTEEYLRAHPQVLDAMRTQQLAFDSGLIENRRFQIESRDTVTLNLLQDEAELARRLNDGLKTRLLGDDAALLQQTSNLQTELTQAQQDQAKTALNNRIIMVGVREDDIQPGTPLAERAAMLQGADAGLRQRLAERATELLEMQARELVLRQSMHTTLVADSSDDVQVAYFNRDGQRLLVDFDRPADAAGLANAIGISTDEAFAKTKWEVYEAAISAAANTGISRVQLEGAFRPKFDTFHDYFRDGLYNPDLNDTQRRQAMVQVMRNSGMGHPVAQHGLNQHWWNGQGHPWSSLHTKGLSLDITEINEFRVHIDDLPADSENRRTYNQFTDELVQFGQGQSVTYLLGPTRYFNQGRAGWRINDNSVRHRDHLHYGQR